MHEIATARALCASMLERLVTPGHTVLVSGNSVELLEHYLYSQLHLLSKQPQESCPLTHAFKECAASGLSR